MERLPDMLRQKYIACIMWQINAVGSTITYQKLLCCVVLYYIGDDKGFYGCWLITSAHKISSFKLCAVNYDSRANDRSITRRHGR